MLFALLSNLQNTETQEVVSVLKDKIVNALICYHLRGHHEGTYRCLQLKLHLTLLCSFYPHICAICNEFNES